LEVNTDSGHTSKLIETFSKFSYIMIVTIMDI